MLFKPLYFAVPGFYVQALQCPRLLQDSALGVGFPQYYVFVSPTHFSMWFLSLLLCRSCSVSPQFFRGNCSVRVHLMCSCEAVSSGSSYPAILDPKSLPSRNFQSNRIIYRRHLKDLKQTLTMGRKMDQTGPESRPPHENRVPLGSPLFVEIAQNNEGKRGGGKCSIERKVASYFFSQFFFSF